MVIRRDLVELRPNRSLTSKNRRDRKNVLRISWFFEKISHDFPKKTEIFDFFKKIRKFLKKFEFFENFKKFGNFSEMFRKKCFEIRKYFRLCLGFWKEYHIRRDLVARWRFVGALVKIPIAAGALVKIPIAVGALGKIPIFLGALVKKQKSSKFKFKKTLSFLFCFFIRCDVQSGWKIRVLSKNGLGVPVKTQKS